MKILNFNCFLHFKIRGILNFSDFYFFKLVNFEFHYFFLRKFYFLYHAKAVIVFPGGFGTMDEVFETLTLIQTRKLNKKMPIILYGREFWDGLINFEHFIKWGVISSKDVELFKIVDNVDDAFASITSSLKQIS